MSGSAWYLLEPVLEGSWSFELVAFSQAILYLRWILSLLSWCFFIFPSFPCSQSLNTGEHACVYTHYICLHVHALKSTIHPCAHICKCTHDCECMHTDACTHAQIHNHTRLYTDTCTDAHMHPHLHLLHPSFTSPPRCSVSAHPSHQGLAPKPQVGDHDGKG